MDTDEIATELREKQERERMKREDLRRRIIPTTIGNLDASRKMGNNRFDTIDLIYLESEDEFGIDQQTGEEEEISPTDYAQMNNAVIEAGDRTRTGKQSTGILLRHEYDEISARHFGVCPALHYNFLPEALQNTEEMEAPKFDIREVKDISGKIIYHTLQIGEYPKTKVDEQLSRILEALYNGGKIKEGISATGRWYSCNGQQKDEKDYAGKHSPEFEYQGNRYVRVISYPNDERDIYSDGTTTGKIGTVRWVKIEPISFVIKNWDEMPKSINPKGTGNAKYFDLRAEEAIIANIPFYPNIQDRNGRMWQNSCVRGFLNGTDVRNITKNGATEYVAAKGGNFTGECNFLNEAFNLSRQPIIEYTIPDSETEIPDDAFNGCITLKKLVLHSEIRTIGKRAFDGLNFKYSYKTKTGELVFSQELPNNKEEYTDVIEIEKIAKHLVGLDYSILVQSEKLEDILKLADTLSKNRFSIPYAYGLALSESGKIESFCENSDFRFFKNEIPNINDMLLKFSEQERLNFFKFATSLGCFSTEKILDEKGNETQVTFAQKASSLLAQLLKTEEMGVR